MTEPTIPWRDGLAEFLPAPKKVQSIIRDVLGLHRTDYEGWCACEAGYDGPGYSDEWFGERADHLTAEIIQALTKEGK